MSMSKREVEPKTLDPVAQEAEEVEHGRARGRDALYYVERDGVPVPASFEEWTAAHERGFPLVSRTEIGDGVVVSTRFFGTRRSPHLPLAPYETMIFGGEHDLWSWWTATRAEAAASHEDACGIARMGAR